MHVMPLTDSRARAERAFLLRSIGRSWREVAAELGYRSRSAAQVAVERHMARNRPESPELTRAQAVAAARATHSILFDRFAAAVEREDDSTAAVLSREMVRNRDQLAKLTGAYAPARAEVSHDVSGLTGPALAEAIRTRALELLPAAAINAGPGAEVIDAELVAAPAPTPTEETAR
ncbi:hypothetical protein [[Mycobacterium] crassicus]|uniref:Uncharacterized protein n=1 Tax=[Mycobacterium] crassicus TaxID=2872309 RepID=A0ABU5XF06_9MYCO|nr:hypothetical protein [Mycolicibacter sp. MYC098]MEB3020885.1 hypothetical protein [Mycolicibacter sp. MYC098]